MLWTRASEQVGFPPLEPVPDEPEEHLDALVDVVAVQGFPARQANEFQVAQVLQAIALPVRLGVNRSVAELGAGLDVEQEQQPVHVTQGFEAKLAGKFLVEFIHPLLAHLAQVADGLVADQFDGFPQGVLEVIGDREGVLMAVVVQIVVQARTFGREQAVAVQESGRGLKRRCFASAEDVVENEAQETIVGPLAPFEEEDLSRGQEQHPASRSLLAKDAPGDDVVPRLLQQPFRGRRFPVKLCRVRTQRERVLVFAIRVVGAKNEKLRRAVLDAARVENRQLFAGLLVQNMVGGRKS